MRVPGGRFLIALAASGGLVLGVGATTWAADVPQVTREQVLIRQHSGTAKTPLVKVPSAKSPSARVLASSSSGPFNIYNLVTGKCVDIPGYGNGTVDGPVNEYTCDFTSGDNQRFYLDWYDSYRFTIRNATDGLCVDVPYYDAVGATTTVTEYYCRPGDGDNQLYRLSDRTGDGDYWIINDKSGLCLDVDGVRTGGNDARLTLYTCSDSDDHIWDFLY